MNKSIVFCREISWDDAIRTNTHSMAEQFRKRNWKCGWVAMSMTPWRMFYPKFQAARKIWREGGMKHEHMFEYSPMHLIAYGGAPLLRSRLVWQSAPSYTVPNIKTVLKRVQLMAPNICWIGSLSMGATAQHIGAKRVIYQAHDAFSQYPDAPLNIKQIELEMVNRADIVVSTSESTTQLLQNLYPKYSERFHTLTHGVNMESYEHVREEPKELEHIPRPRAILVGTLDLEDDRLLAYLAKALPDLSFVLIGPGGNRIAQRAKDGQLGNIHILGPRSQGTLPDYLKSCDIGLIAYPFEFRDSRRYGTNPMKRYEYAAAGLPTVSVDLREYSINASPIFIATNREDFVEQIRLALYVGSEYRRELISFASQNTWDMKYHRLMELIQEW